LLPEAPRIIDSLQGNGYGTLDFRLGGGMVLIFRFDHRVSKDIDVFIHDAQALGFLSPHLNDVAGMGLLEYQEQANALKFILPLGDIDIIVAGNVTREQPGEALDFMGRRIPLDTTAEISAKKLLYRAESFKARDVFDMAVALALDRPAATKALQAAASTRTALLRRLQVLAEAPPAHLTRDLMLTKAGAADAGGMVAILAQAVRDTAKGPP
jgi:hypothetical protein